MGSCEIVQKLFVLVFLFFDEGIDIKTRKVKA
jgi:hypothetical protein